MLRPRGRDAAADRSSEDPAMRRLVLLIAVLATCALATPGTALADKPTLVPYSNGPFVFDLCGVPTSLTLVGTERNHPGGVQNQAGVATYTNLLTGASVTGTTHATLREISVTENAQGGLSYTYAIHGLLLQLRDGHRVLLVDAGRLVATDAFDALGNFLSHTVLETPGPTHDDASAFCAAYLAATA
jgi:hypothetical protein